MNDFLVCGITIALTINRHSLKFKQMKNLIKLCIFALMIFSFTACFPVMMSHRDGGNGRWNYNNHNYNSGREYRQARRGGSVELNIHASNDNNGR